ncbi:pseudouridine synthase [Candidatus Hepatincola sp. Pdp]
MAERIAKRIAKLGYCSRRQAEELIFQKKVKVNGTVIDTPVVFVESTDIIEINNQQLAQDLISTRLFMYYKPTGYICSNADEQGRKTIFDNLPEDLPRLIYVGRLDLNSEGLLLLTTNGTLAHALTNSQLALNRTYKVRVFGEVKQTDLENLALGITINGIEYKPIIADIIHKQGKNTWLEITITEGKNREIRNICEYLGLQVSRLIRTAFGSYNLQQTPLQEGEVVEVSPKGLKKYLSKELFAELFPKDFKPIKAPSSRQPSKANKYSKAPATTTTRKPTNSPHTNKFTKPIRTPKLTKPISSKRQAEHTKKSPSTTSSHKPRTSSKSTNAIDSLNTTSFNNTKPKAFNKSKANKTTRYNKPTNSNNSNKNKPRNTNQDSKVTSSKKTFKSTTNIRKLKG